MSNLFFEADIDDKRLDAKVKKIDSDLAELARKAANSGSHLDNAFKNAANSAGDLEKKTINVGNAMQYIGTLVSLSVLSGWAKEIANVRGEFQKFEAVLTNTLNGDNVKASSLLQGLSDFAAKTPYQLQDITENFVKLANQGIVLTQQELVKLGDFAAVTGKPIGQLFEAIMDVNNPERWKEFGARIATEGEKVMITFRGQKVEFDRTIQGAKDAIAELGSMKGVEGTMAVISKTLIGQISNFQDAWDRMLNELGKANEETFSGMITGATGLVENYKTIIDVLGAIALTYGAGKAAAILYNAVMVEQAVRVGYVTKMQKGLITWTQIQELWTKRAAAAQAALNKTMLANPYALAATAIVGMVAGLVILNKKFDESIDAKKRFDEQTKSLTDSYDNRISESDKLIRTIQSETEAESKRVEALRTLKELYPDIFGQIDLHNAKLLNSVDTTKKMTEAEARLFLMRQREYVASLVRERDKLTRSLNSTGNASLGEDGLANPFPIYDQRKLDQLNQLIQKESDRETQMIIDRVNAEQTQREEAEKTIQMRIKEADSIEKLGKLREEWENKWKASTNQSERNKLKGELDLIEKSLDVLSGKTSTKEITGEYNKLTDAIKKASDAVLNASVAERPALQEKLAALVKQKEAYDALMKAQRGETVGMKTVKPIDASIDSKPVQAASLEVDKLGKSVDKTKKKAADLKKEMKVDPGAIDLINERYEKQKQIIEETLSFIDQTVSRYGEMLGLSEDQQKSLENGLNAFKGMAQIASGNVIQGSFTLLASVADSLIQTPEKLSESFESVHQNIQKVIKSIEVAETALGNLNKDSTGTSLKIVKAQLLDLADSAKYLNEELSQSSTGKRRTENSNLPNIVQQAAELNAEIEKLSNRLLQGDISDDQRKAIEAILDSYNSLLAEIDSTIQEITGTTVSDFARSLSDAIIDGADAWDVWEKKANDVIRNVISRQLTQQILTKPITDAVNALVNDSTNGLTSAESKKFQDTIRAIYESSKPIYDATMQSLRDAGIDVTGNSAASRSPLTGSIAGASEETMSMLAGQTMAIRNDIKINQNIMQNQLEAMDASLSVLQAIDRNTRGIARLETIENELKSMNDNIKKLQ